MKRSIADLALFGGRRIFDSPRPIGQLAAPDLAEYLRLIEPAVRGRRTGGHGPVERQLENELADYHGVRHCISLASAALGIVLLIRVFAGSRKGHVIMPSFSYRGLPHFARWASQEPLFCEVDGDSHTLEPAAVAGALAPTVTSILAVANFNHSGDIAALEALASTSGTALFFDSVYAMGNTHGGRRMGGFGQAEVFSLHATKLLNGFEGGYVTTNDDSLAGSLRELRDGGGIDRDLPCAPLEARLNEMHAAMALLNLRRIDETIAANYARYEAYRRGLEDIPEISLVPYRSESGESSNYQMAVIEVAESSVLARDDLLGILRAEGMMISAYYSPPLHKAPGASGSATRSLPLTERLGQRYLQLPVGEKVSVGDISQVCGLIQFVLASAGSIASRLAR